ncbi:MAG: hypothetical protein R3E83_06190 [Burkholderiaceae bacterium]
MVVWVAVVVVFFSIPQSKLLGYVLPAVPPLAVLLAQGVGGWLRSEPPLPWRWWASPAVSTVLGVATIIGVAIAAPHSTRPLGEALRAAHRAGEPVLMFERFYFDLPFYAQLREPVRVALNWTDPAIRRQDNWRKEPRRRRRLRHRSGDPAADHASGGLAIICNGPVSWLVTANNARAEAGYLPASARLFAQTRETSLWRIGPAAAADERFSGCAQTPTND